MKVLVTTPTAGVGRELVRLLKRRFVPMRLGAPAVEEARAAFPGLQAIRLDYADPGTFAAGLAGIDAVFLAAPCGQAAEPEMRLVDAAKAAGVKRVVKLSVLGLEESEAPPRRVERHLQASGLAWTTLRPAPLMQDYATRHAEAIRAGTLQEPAGSGRSALVDARDVAEVAVVALTKPGHEGHAYALTGPEPLDRRGVAATLSRELGRTVHYVSLSDSQFRTESQGRLSPGCIEQLSALYAQVRAGQGGLKTEEVEKLLGRPPRPFAEFVKEHRAAWA